MTLLFRHASLIAAFVACAAAAQAHVTKVTLSPAALSGPVRCPVQQTFIGQITSTRAGQVGFEWTTSDGQHSPLQQAIFATVFAQNNFVEDKQSSLVRKGTFNGKSVTILVPSEQRRQRSGSLVISGNTLAQILQPPPQHVAPVQAPLQVQVQVQVPVQTQQKNN